MDIMDRSTWELIVSAIMASMQVSKLLPDYLFGKWIWPCIASFAHIFLYVCMLMWVHMQGTQK